MLLASPHRSRRPRQPPLQRLARPTHRERPGPRPLLATQFSNVLFDITLSHLANIFGFWIAEKVAVSACVLIFFWGVFALISAVADDPQWILMPCIATLAYGYAFNMGFMNYYLSLGLGAFCLSLVWPVTTWEGKEADCIIAALILILAWLAHPIGCLWVLTTIAYVAAHHQPRRLAQTSRSRRRRPRVDNLSLVSPPSSRTRRRLEQWPAVLAIQRRRSAHGLRRPLCHPRLGGARVRRHLHSHRARPQSPQRRLVAWPRYAGRALPRGLLRRRHVPRKLPRFDVRRLDRSARFAPHCHLRHSRAYGSGPREPPPMDHRRLHRHRKRPISFSSASIPAPSSDLEACAEAAVAKLPPETRIIPTLRADPDWRVEFVSHVADRACIRHCFVYSNYEPPSKQFRIRVKPGATFIVTDSAEDADDMQGGGYEIDKRDLPVKQLYQCDPSDWTKLCLHDLAEGESTGHLGYPLH